MVPNTNFAYLEEFSELHITPTLSRNDGEDSRKIERLCTSENDQKSKIITKDFRKIKKKNNRNDKNSVQTEDKRGFDIWPFVADFLGMKSQNYAVLNEVPKQNGRPFQTTSDSTAGSRHEYRDKHVEKLMRVHPIASQSQHVFQPFQAFVDEGSFQSLCCCGASDATSSSNRVFMRISRVKSPTEKRLEKKKNGKEKEIDVTTNECECIVYIVYVL